MDELTPDQRTTLRRAVREVLAGRPGIALPFAGVRRRLEQAVLVDFIFSDGEMRSALALLNGLGQIKASHDPLGSTEYYQATATGILAFERNE